MAVISPLHVFDRVAKIVVRGVVTPLECLGNVDSILITVSNNDQTKARMPQSIPPGLRGQNRTQATSYICRCPRRKFA